MRPRPQPLRVAIACGGTGGHLFPGLAVAEVLEARGVEVDLFISQKEVDQQAVRGWPAERVFRLPAVAGERRRLWACWRGFRQSWTEVRRHFRARPPGAVLAFGSFTSVPPVLAARAHGARRLLHEANAVPGRANRWLAHVVDEALVHFPSAAERLWHPRVRTVGMPVRPQFQPGEAGAARLALRMRPEDPVLLVTGGSQGARPLNELVLRLLPSLNLLLPHLQVLHLTGALDYEAVRRRYAELRFPACVRPFLTEMELALAAATAMISRAGASSLAETAAMGVPALLVPLPSAADNHQYHNARHFAASGAARMVTQAEATPERVLAELRGLLEEGPLRAGIQAALVPWQHPAAAEKVAAAVLDGWGPAPEEPGHLRPSASQASASVQPDPERVRSRSFPPAPVPERFSGLADELRSRLSPAALVLASEPLAARTTLKVGGPADLYVEPASEADLSETVRFCRERAIPLRLLGRGSNLLVRDGGIRGVVVRLAQPAFTQLRVCGHRLEAGAGVRLKDLAQAARRQGLAGLEFLEGIPGSVGGALRMNAGAHAGWTFAVVETVRYMTPEGEVRERPAREIPAGYRSCDLLATHIALAAVFAAQPACEEKVRERMDAFSRHRWETQPRLPSAGCVFKNPAAVPAGRLIQELGLKGTRVGGAEVSEVHANFLVNRGGATAADFLALIERIRACALATRGVQLEPEVEIVGDP